jgi:hypothetical protein
MNPMHDKDRKKSDMLLTQHTKERKHFEDIGTDGSQY